MLFECSFGLPDVKKVIFCDLIVVEEFRFKVLKSSYFTFALAIEWYV